MTEAKHSQEEVRSHILSKLVSHFRSRYCGGYYSKYKIEFILKLYDSILESIVNKIYYSYSTDIRQNMSGLSPFDSNIYEQYLLREVPELENNEFYFLEEDNEKSIRDAFSERIKTLEQEQARIGKDINNYLYFCGYGYGKGAAYFNKIYSEIEKKQKEVVDLECYEPPTDIVISQYEDLITSIKTLLEQQEQHLVYLRQLNEVEKEIKMLSNKIIVLEKLEKEK